ncbi:MAG: VOC family protein [Nitrospinaceae bacterium]|nr:VOC family protein [Nitrospinaceae bacterium]
MTTNATNKEAPLKLAGLDHIALNVTDMDRAENFYSNILGFPVINRTLTQAGFQHIELDAGNIAIALFESPELDLKLAHKTMTDDGYLHFAFGTTYDQFDATVHALKQNKIAVDGEPRDWGKSVSVYFRDPDGHQLEINFAK